MKSPEIFSGDFLVFYYVSDKGTKNSFYKCISFEITMALYLILSQMLTNNHFI